MPLVGRSARAAPDRLGRTSPRSATGGRRAVGRQRNRRPCGNTIALELPYHRRVWQCEYDFITSEIFCIQSVAEKWRYVDCGRPEAP
jgi:hypothetical protein